MRSTSKIRAINTHFLAADMVGWCVRRYRGEDHNGFLWHVLDQHARRSCGLEPFRTLARARDEARSSLPFFRPFAILPFEQIQRHVHNHVLLPTDHAAATQLDQDVHSFDAILLGGRFAMA